MKIRVAKAALILFTLLPSAGCSYFRWSEPSYQELHQRAQEQPTGESNFKRGESVPTP